MCSRPLGVVPGLLHLLRRRPASSDVMVFEMSEFPEGGSVHGDLVWTRGGARCMRSVFTAAKKETDRSDGVLMVSVNRPGN